MIKNLQSLLFLVFVLLSFSNSSAQIERVKQYHQELNKKAVLPAEVETNIQTESEQKRPHVLIKNNSVSQEVNSSTPPDKSNINFLSEDIKEVNKEKTSRLARIIITETNSIPIEILNNPIYPDFQVVATKEVTYESKLDLKEKLPEQLSSLSIDLPEEGTKHITDTTPTVLISPLKRKYLEGVVLELEMEIKEKKISKESMQEKKKELDDLKRLLAN